jgi:capsular exopolysaccharide synthesis family protein
MSNADQLLGVLWRRRITVAVTFLCVLAAVAAVTFSLPKTYSTSAYVIVNPARPASSDFAAQQVSQVDTQTTAELLQTRNTADLVARALPYSASAQAIQGRVDIAPVASTQLVLITANESSPQRAQQLANTYANVFTTEVARTIGFARPSVSEPAPLITEPSSPVVSLYLLVGAVIALLAGAGAAVLRERLDRRLRIDPFSAELLGLPILARVPEVPARRRRAGAAATHHDVRFLEGFRWVFANLAFVRGGDRPATVAVVSAGEQEGKSMVCVAMANAAEEVVSGGVLLVDADLRRPTLERRLGVTADGDEGLSTYLAEQSELGDGVPQLARRVADSNIALVPAGPTPPNPAGLLGQPVLGELVTDARRLYDVVIFDTPPISVGADASLVAGVTDGAILVVDGRTSRRASIEWSLEQLRRARVNVLGVIVNRVSPVSTGTYGYSRERNAKRPRRGRRSEKAPA